MGDVPTKPSYCRLQVILPCASESGIVGFPFASTHVPKGTVLAAGTGQVPGSPAAAGAVGTQANMLTLGMANPVASTTIAWKAPGITVPAWPVKLGPVTVSPGIGVMNWTVGV